jgi:HSP20 family protein
MAGSGEKLFGGNPLERVQQEFTRWVDAARITGERAMDAVGLASDQRPLPPPCDLLETETDLHLVVDLPGVAVDNVTLSLTGQVLTLGANRPSLPFGEADARFHLRERIAVQFERDVALPVPIDPDGIRAVVRDGMLHVTMRKDRQLQSRPIPVQRGTADASASGPTTPSPSVAGTSSSFPRV